MNHFLQEANLMFTHNIKMFTHIITIQLSSVERGSGKSECISINFMLNICTC